MANNAHKKVSIVVPVYGDWLSLHENIESLRRHYSNKDWVEVYYVNDCGPEADILESKIKKSIDGLSNFYYYRNKENLGFIKNVNNAVFNIVEDKKSDILLLNSDTRVEPDAIENMLQLMNSHKDLGAINPRTNDAIMFGGVSISVPLDASFALKPDKSYELFKKNTRNTPEYNILPVFSGFCVLIRREIINKIGLLDEIYDKGYFDDNDMSMRIRELGYKCAVSNRAFVTHFKSKSFSDHYRVHRSEVNQKIFIKRYPDYFDYINQYPETLVVTRNKKISPAVKMLELTAKVLRYGDEYGYKNALKKGVKSVVKKRLPSKLDKRPAMVHVWFHEITNTGAPLVLLDVLREWKKGKFPKNVAYFYPPHVTVDSEAMLNFINEGIHPNVASIIDLDFRVGDVVILNSALPEWLYNSVFTSLNNGILKHAYLYLHENNELYLSKHTDELLKKNLELLKNGKITMYVPSEATANGWKNSLGVNKNVFVMSGRVKLDPRMFKEKHAEDFNEINFVSSGSSVPRKGYLSTVYAFIAFYNSFYCNNPSAYRNFSLNIWGVSSDDYFYNDFLENAAKGLSDHIKLLPKQQSMDAVYDFYAKNNFNITYSIDETYSMVTMENMSFGYPIIRSEVPGLKEQLIIGKNGWLTPTTDWWSLVTAIEEILNKDKTSNEKLKTMSDMSMRIAKESINRKYRLLEDIQKDLA